MLTMASLESDHTELQSNEKALAMAGNALNNIISLSRFTPRV